LLGTPVGPVAEAGRRAALTFDERCAPCPGSTRQVGVGVTNRGDVTWPDGDARHRVTFGYRWLDDCERVLTRRRRQTSAWDVAPGETVPARIVCTGRAQRA
jgi:hypothetical protein